MFDYNIYKYTTKWYNNKNNYSFNDELMYLMYIFVYILAYT